MRYLILVLISIGNPPTDATMPDDRFWPKIVVRCIDDNGRALLRCCRPWPIFAGKKSLLAGLASSETLKGQLRVLLPEPLSYIGAHGWIFRVWVSKPIPLEFGMPLFSNGWNTPLRSYLSIPTYNSHFNSRLNSHFLLSRSGNSFFRSGNSFLKNSHFSKKNSHFYLIESGNLIRN